MSDALARRDGRTEPLATLARRINDEHATVTALAGEALRHARRAGALLLEAKSRTPHGSWLSWLHQQCRFSPRTAQAYMQIASRWDEIEEKTQRVADLGFREALQLLARPRPQPEHEADGHEADGFRADEGRATPRRWEPETLVREGRAYCERLRAVVERPHPPLDPTATSKLSDTLLAVQHAASVALERLGGESLPGDQHWEKVDATLVDPQGPR